MSSQPRPLTPVLADGSTTARVHAQPAGVSAAGPARLRWRAIGLALALPTALVGALVLRAGPVAPYTDTWIAAGIVRALSDRPLPSFGLGGVPKAAQLLVDAPAALVSPERAAAVLTLIGALALLCCLAAHVAYWWRALADERRVEASITLALLATAPLVWRSTFDGSSVAWAWTLIVIAVAMLRRTGSLRGPLIALAAAALFRPEAAGSAMAIALWWASSAPRDGRMVRMKGAALLAAVPSATFVVGVAVVDLVWTGHLGASARGYAAYVDAYAAVTPPLTVGLRLAAVATLLGVGAATVVGGAIGLVASRFQRGRRAAATSDTTLILAALGWIAVVLVHRVVGGGAFFDRFFFPLATIFAAGAARLIGLPRRPSLSLALAAAMVLSTLVSWMAYGPQVAGSSVQGEAAREAARLASLFPPGASIATDVGVRAVAVGSGLRPWRTTFVVNDPEVATCELQGIVVREQVLPPETIRRAAACGEWRSAVLADGQRERGILVLIRR